MTQSYNVLEQKFKTLSAIEDSAAILHWDASTMMPKNSADSRGEQLATLSGIAHSNLISTEVSDLLDEAESHITRLNKWQQANLRLMRKRWLHASALDPEMVEAFSRAGSHCEIVWRTARQEANYSLFAESFEPVLELTKEIATIKGETLGCSPYDALLDQFDAGRTSQEIDDVFLQLEQFLPDFISHVCENQQNQPDPLPLAGPFPKSQQKDLGLQFMEAFGFDFNRGRLDTSTHPFCGGTADDVRITTRYNEDDFTSALMGVLHETGHALYELNLPKKWRGQPVGSALGMSMHESQSLLIEMQVCRSYDFLHYATPIIAKSFTRQQDLAFQADNLYRVFTHVEPSFIRVDADEVTYPIHVIIRYNLEKALISGELSIDEIPEAWNAAIKDMLGITVPNDGVGCLQDIHWSDGSFGYFPTYTLGAMQAAQFYDAARKQNPELTANIRKGDFTLLTNWLKENIHEQGSCLNTGELLENVTGKKLDVNLFKQHLKNKYLS